MAVPLTAGIAVKASDRNPAMIVSAEKITGRLMNLRASSIADCGLRIADSSIADCGLLIADCGLRIADSSIADCGLLIAGWSAGSFRNPKSAIRNPQYEIPIWLMT